MVGMSFVISTANFTWLREKAAGLYCIPYKAVSSVLFVEPFSIFLAVFVTLPISSFFIVLPVIINILFSVLPNIFFVALLALIYMTVCHSCVLIKSGEGLNLSALKALLFSFHTYLY